MLPQLSSNKLETNPTIISQHDSLNIQALSLSNNDSSIIREKNAQIDFIPEKSLFNTPSLKAENSYVFTIPEQEKIGQKNS